MVEYRTLILRQKKPDVQLALDKFLLDRKQSKEKILWNTFSLEVDVLDNYIISIHCMVKRKKKKK